jgi:hypothetical protein
MHWLHVELLQLLHVKPKWFVYDLWTPTHVKDQIEVFVPFTTLKLFRYIDKICYGNARWSLTIV